MDIIDDIKQRLSIFNNLFDTLRLVDPLNKKTITVKDDDIEESEGTCYGFWKNQSFCENCISMRAFIEKDTCVKIELQEEKVFLVIASSINVNERQYIVEMLKDISNGPNFFKRKEEIKDIKDILNSMNDKIIMDELTGIYNKRYINERLPVDINNSKINGFPLSLIIVDIDFFKQVNDAYGHVIGDKALTYISNIISSSIRNTTDWVGRYGGDEFLIALNNTNAEDAYNVAEKIRNILEQSVFQCGDIRIILSASFGIYEIVDKTLDFEEAIKGADKNLYMAKNLGRNRIV